MKPELILQADVLDIIFENRNKDYGVYVLRKEYSQRLFYSLSGVLGVLLSGFIFLFWNDNQPPRRDTFNPAYADTLRPIHIPIPDNPPPKLKQAPPAPPAKTIANPPPIIVPDTEKTDTIPTIEEREKAVISDRTTDGPPISTENILPPAGGGGTGDPKPEQPVVVEPSVLEVAEVKPEFPGGLSAWQRFLQKNLRFPDKEAENEAGRKIVVTVKFIVNEDGSLSGLEIIQSGGEEFDREVLRVLARSPKWVAGSNKGKKVKVYHKQPVVFKYEADE